MKQGDTMVFKNLKIESNYEKLISHSVKIAMLKDVQFFFHQEKKIPEDSLQIISRV